MRTHASLLRSGIAWSLPAALWLAAGCASHDRSQETNRPGSGIVEYRQLASAAQKSVGSALNALAMVSAQSERCPPEVLSNFVSEVRQLQVESVQVRARSQAIQARGDAYFNDWHSNLTRVRDPEVRALAEKHHAQLAQSFGRIKELSQEGHENFRPFIGALRQLRNSLEKDPASLSTAATQSSLKTAKENGQRVTHFLEGITRELDSMSSLITPPGKSIPQS